MEDWEIFHIDRPNLGKALLNGNSKMYRDTRGTEKMKEMEKNISAKEKSNQGLEWPNIIFVNVPSYHTVPCISRNIVAYIFVQLLSLYLFSGSSSCLKWSFSHSQTICYRDTRNSNKTIIFNIPFRHFST